MMDMDEMVAIYGSAISLYGTQLQSIVALEELSELQKEICKMQRGCGNVEHLAEEIADVQIMLWQLCAMHNLTNVTDYVHAKTARLAERIKLQVGGQQYGENRTD